MEMSDSFRVSDEMTKTAEILDFVVNSAEAVETISAPGDGCRSLKSLGIYLESTTNAMETNNNAGNVSISDSNNNNTASCNVNDELIGAHKEHEKEQNNNHLLAANGLTPYVEGNSGQCFWASGGTAKDQIRWDQSMLEELGCWSQEAENGGCAGAVAAVDENTDGAIYTLTVLNGGCNAGDSWYRLATESERSPASAIDIDSLLNNLLPPPVTNTSQQPAAPVACFQLPPYTQDNNNIPANQPSNRLERESPPPPPPSKSDCSPTQYLFQQSQFLQMAVNNNLDAQTVKPTQPANCNNNNTLKCCNTTDCVSNNSNIVAVDNPKCNKSNCSNKSRSSNNNSISNGVNDNNNNSSEWTFLKTGSNESEARVNSLLRNALQGKSGPSSFTARYDCVTTRKTGEAGDGSSLPLPPLVISSTLEGCLVETALSPAPAPPQPQGTPPPPIATHHMDDLFLSQLDVVGYGDDYDQLKTIEHEVATSVHQYCTATQPAYFSVAASGATSTANSSPSSIALVGHSPSKAASKKYMSKRCSAAALKIDATSSAGCSSHGHGHSSTASGNGRKERSLHYCTICHKGFKDKYSVNVHVRTHTGEKPFACAFCGKNFRQKAHLAKHHHTHSVHKSSPPNPASSNPNKTQTNSPKQQR